MDYGPALKEKSTHYPVRWNGRTPKTIRMLREVCGDAICAFKTPGRCSPVAHKGTEYPAWTNSHGAVCAVFPDGEHLGVKPREFEVVEWFEADGVTVTREGEKPKAEAWTGGPMTIERALEITGACVRVATSLLIDGERVPLPDCGLEEMLAANRMVEAHKEAPVTKDGKTTTTIHMHVAPRLLAAFYALQQYGDSPGELLGALGFSLTSGDDGEDDE